MKIFLYRKIVSLFAFVLLTGLIKTHAQNRDAYDPVSFIRLTSKNDLYQLYLRSDKHFTNGAHIQFTGPVFDNVVFRKLLLGDLLKGNNNFVVSFGQDMYTPEDYTIEIVDSTDRPYAGLLYTSVYRIAGKPSEKLILRSGITIGITGPASGAEKTQNFIHRLTGDDLAAGWANQIGNGLILDYNILLRAGIKKLPSWLDISGILALNAGSLMNYGTAGSRIQIGKFNNPYYNMGLYQKNDDNYTKSFLKRYNVQYYFSLELIGGGMLYNGTASGSLIPFQKNPYVLPPEDIDPWFYGAMYGMTFSFQNFLLRYQRIVSNRQFNSGWHGWGELNLLYSF